jgi:hypothetical protein
MGGVVTDRTGDDNAMSDNMIDGHHGERELHELLAAVCDETLTSDQAARLAQRLREDPAARRFYVRYLDMHARLLGLPGLATEARQPDREAVIAVPWRPRRLVRAVLPLAGVALVGLGLVFGLKQLEQEPAGDRVSTAPAARIAAEPPAVVGAYVATIASASSVAQLDGRPAVVGGRLLPSSCEVTAGSLTVRFDGGAEIFFDTGSRFRITSRRSLEVEEGAFVFQGDATCEPLAITTPQATLVDVGTRYAAVVKPGVEELHVVDGAVRRSAAGPTAGTEEFVKAGVGRAYDDGAPQGREIPIDAALVQRGGRDEKSGARPSPPDADERFDAAADSIDGADGGRGWRDAWIAHRGTTPPMAPFAITVPGLLPDGSGAIVNRGGGPRAAHRRLERPIDLSADDVRYVRYLVRREASLPGDNNLAMLVLRKHGLTVEEELARQSFIQLAVCRDDTVALKFLGQSVRSSTVLPQDATMAVVAKLVSGAKQPDQVFLRVMPASRLEDREPQDWNAVSESVATDLVFDQVSVEVVSRGTVWIDDIAIGPSWASIALPRKDAP